MQLQKKRMATAAVELALLLPFLMFLWVVSIDWARLFYYDLAVRFAARQGAYQASNPSEIDTAITTTQAVLYETTNMTPNPTVNVAYSSAYDGSYSAGESNQQFVEVTVTWTFSTITNFPGVPKDTVLQRTAKMKVAPSAPSGNADGT